jgi:8-oxo-dGTP pyrophosphatase MutT (NUDIX family)
MPLKHSPEQNPWHTKSIREVYDNPWIQISHHEVITPAGTDGVYGVVHFKNLAIGIVPLDEEGNTWLVGQYRYTLKEYSWEIPEGGCPLGTDPLESARRELREETGITATKWSKILDLQTSNSVTDETGIAFLAQGLSFGPSAPEETEELQVKKIPIEEAFQLVHQGVIRDALSMMSLMKVELMLKSGEIALSQ